MKAVRCWSDADAEVWCIDVSQPLAAGEMQQLSEDELARAARFVQERDSRRYLGSRHALRCMLAGVTGLRVEDIAIGRGPHGKPFMVGHAGWRFSLSRRIDVALVGISVGREIGVDVEPVGNVQDMEAMVQQVCSANERDLWTRRPEPGRPTAFATCWTRKEACLKAVGMGLSVEPSAIDVGLDRAVRHVKVPALMGEVLVRVESFAVDAGLIGSIAAVA